MTKKRIILTSALGIVAIATLTTSITIAWYGASNQLGINTFDIGIVGSNNLKISTKTDLDSFRENITNQELLDEIGKRFLLEPVSAMCKNTWMDEQKDMPVFYDCSSSLTPSSGIPDLKVATTGFFSKKIYLLSAASFYVSLDMENNATFLENNNDANFSRAQAVYADIKKQNPETTTTIEEIKLSLDNLKYCLRASFLFKDIDGNYQYKIIDPWKDESDKTIYGGLLDNDGNGYFDTYTDLTEGMANKKEKEVVYGEVNDRSLIVYDDPVSTSVSSNNDFSPSYNPYFGNSFEGLNKETAYTFNEEASLENGLEFAKEESISFENLRANNSLIKIPCYKDTVTEVVISVFLEGWDHQCINATMGAGFETKFSFKLNGGII
ncbi:MAG: hypothetical protein MJ216_03180 [Bacilli bacterium]|nr:hypothetical protein [Bacilli bacterium]